MSIIIFFSMAFFIFISGLIAISLAIYNWYKQSVEARALKIEKSAHKV